MFIPKNSSLGQQDQVYELCISIYLSISLSIYINWDSLHAQLNCHYKGWSYKKKKRKKIKARRKSV